jgi:purine-cytosine permease-like protein
MAEGAGLVILLVVVGLVFLFGLLFQIFWNDVVTVMVTWANQISYWTAFWFVVLFALLFGASKSSKHSN